MTIRLLPKSEIDQRKAAEQRVSVEEGIKLARRVDNLREVAAEEEQSLSEYRVKTLTKIHEDTKEAAEKRDSLQKEVADLEDRKREALKPIEEERFNLNLDKTAFNSKQEDLDTRLSAVREREERAHESEREADRLLGVARNCGDASHDALRAALYNKEATELALKEATERKEGVVRFEREVKDTLMHREKIVEGREKGVTLRAEEVTKQEAFIRDEKIRLADREATLARNINRINKTYVG